jgi:putative NIF3 family GTP cyclohydrolase 1 type 2
MKLSKLCERILAYGIDKDPRYDRRSIARFQDSALLYGDPDTPVKKIMVGIDIEVPEILLADHIRRREGLDLVLSHHPSGPGIAGLPEVMRLQEDVLRRAGLAKSVAAHYVEERQREVQRRVSPSNCMRTVDAARLLKMPFLCMHTPADNHAASYIQRLLAGTRSMRLADVLERLLEVPEYRLAQKDSLGPRIILGNPRRKAGKILVEMTGGTEGPREVYPSLYRSGVRTLVSMHLSEEHFKRVKDANLNVIIAGHISSDTLGMNLLLDRLCREEAFSIIDCSGFRRVKR